MAAALCAQSELCVSFEQARCWLQMQRTRRRLTRHLPLRGPKAVSRTLCEHDDARRVRTKEHAWRRRVTAGLGHAKADLVQQFAELMQ